MLGRAGLTAFASLEEILSVLVDEAMIREHRKMARLIGDMALGPTKLGLPASEGVMRRQRDAARAELLAEIQADKTRGEKG
jgi:hypothetical protein